MFPVDHLILLAAILILVGIVSSKLSARLGLPVLVLFLVIGMLAGESGIGGIAFDNPAGAHALGTLALAMILFDGGLQTPTSSIKKVWKPASLLATVGVLITALITGLAAAYILGLPLLEGFYWAPLWALQTPQRCFRCCAMLAYILTKSLSRPWRLKAPRTTQWLFS